MFEGIAHIGITVSNLEKSVEFYRDCLGLNLISDPTDFYDDALDAAGVGVPGAKTRFCTFNLGKGQMLELVEYKERIPGMNRALPPNALGHHHISFKVDDINKWVEKLTQKGVDFVYKPIRIEGGVFDGLWWVYFKDPDGIIIELDG